MLELSIKDLTPRVKKYHSRETGESVFVQGDVELPNRLPTNPVRESLEDSSHRDPCKSLLCGIPRYETTKWRYDYRPEISVCPTKKRSRLC